MDFVPCTMKSGMANCGVRLSPIDPSLIAIASAQNFGIVGGGRAQVFKIQIGGFSLINTLEDKEAVFDIAWTQLNPSTLVLGTGGGSLILWDFTKGPLWQIQTGKQINSVECSYKQPLFLATSMSGFFHVGDLVSGKILHSLLGSQGNCLQGVWHPHQESMFSTVGRDGMLKLWDLKSPNLGIANVPAHSAEVHCCDFNKYDDTIVTGSADRTVRVWDLRNLSLPLHILVGHRYTIKRVKTSPFRRELIATGAMDMNVNIYNLAEKVPLVMTHSQHTQFVTGLDFSLHHQQLLASTSWDGRTLLWNFMAPMPIVP